MRTAAQRYANSADSDLYKMAGAMETLAKMVNDPGLDELSRELMSSRRRVRSHMHRDDREGTEG